MAAGKSRGPGRPKGSKTRKRASPRSPVRPRKRREPPAGEPDRGGRPAIEWGPGAAADIMKLARAHNTVEDMAAILGVSKRALESAIADGGEMHEAYRAGIAERRDAIRTAQLRYALKGNATLLIWLGKQDLGQRDFQRLEVGGFDGGQIPLGVGVDLKGVVRKRLTEYLRSRGKGPKGKPDVGGD